MSTTGERGLLACSFCGKNEHQVRKLVAGPSSYICDECVAIASRIMERSDEPPSTGGRGWWDRIRRWLRRGMLRQVAFSGVGI